jgi:hypothetical protein
MSMPADLPSEMNSSDVHLVPNFSRHLLSQAGAVERKTPAGLPPGLLFFAQGQI